MFKLDRSSQNAKKSKTKKQTDNLKNKKNFPTKLGFSYDCFNSHFKKNNNGVYWSVNFNIFKHTFYRL